MIELRVEDNGEAMLVYVLSTISEASEMIVFLRPFLPEARFVVQPLRH
ncbi:MAG: hypothetical protein AAF646_03340 [Pseudomonadota bacterium]